MYGMSTIQNNLIVKINKLTKYLNRASIIEIITASLAIISIVGWFLNWRVGHENAFEKVMVELFSPFIIIWFVLWVLATISLIVIVTCRGYEIKKLVATGSSESYDKPNMPLMVFASLPIITVIVIVLVEIVRYGILN